MEKMIPIQNWLINEEPKDLLADLGIGVPISSEIGMSLKIVLLAMLDYYLEML